MSDEGIEDVSEDQDDFDYGAPPEVTPIRSVDEFVERFALLDWRSDDIQFHMALTRQMREGDTALLDYFDQEINVLSRYLQRHRNSKNLIKAIEAFNQANEEYELDVSMIGTELSVARTHITPRKKFFEEQGTDNNPHGFKPIFDEVDYDYFVDEQYARSFLDKITYAILDNNYDDLKVFRKRLAYITEMGDRFPDAMRSLYPDQDFSEHFAERQKINADLKDQLEQVDMRIKVIEMEAEEKIELEIKEFFTDLASEEYKAAVKKGDLAYLANLKEQGQGFLRHMRKDLRDLESEIADYDKKKEDYEGFIKVLTNSVNAIKRDEQSIKNRNKWWNVVGRYVSDKFCQLINKNKPEQVVSENEPEVDLGDSNGGQGLDEDFRVGEDLTVQPSLEVPIPVVVAASNGKTNGLVSVVSFKEEFATEAGNNDDILDVGPHSPSITWSSDGEVLEDNLESGIAGRPLKVMLEEDDDVVVQEIVSEEPLMVIDLDAPATLNGHGGGALEGDVIFIEDEDPDAAAEDMSLQSEEELAYNYVLVQAEQVPEEEEEHSAGISYTITLE